MLVALDALFSGNVDSIDIDCYLDFTDIKIDGEFPFKSPVHVIGEVLSHASLVEIDADAVFEYTAMCARCCESATVEHEIPIIHTLVTELSDEADADDGEYVVCEDMKLDLMTLAVEDILLNLPAVHLCKDDCKGLCPTCGANLNNTSCECKKPIDPRLEALLDFGEDE